VVPETEQPNPKLFTNVENAKADVEMLKATGWNWIFIDTPPALMEWIEMGVLAADAVLIPVRASPIDLESMDPAIELCEVYGRPFAFVLTHYDAKWKLSKTAIPVLEERGKVFAEALGYRQAYVGSMLAGRTGPEFSDREQAQNAAKEVDALWEAVKKLAKTVKLSRVRHDRRRHQSPRRRHRPEHSPQKGKASWCAVTAASAGGRQHGGEPRQGGAPEAPGWAASQAEVRTASAAQHRCVEGD
jgi:hypothetical protein